MSLNYGGSNQSMLGKFSPKLVANSSVVKSHGYEEQDLDLADIDLDAQQEEIREDLEELNEAEGLDSREDFLEFDQTGIDEFSRPHYKRGRDNQGGNQQDQHRQRKKRKFTALKQSNPVLYETLKTIGFDEFSDFLSFLDKFILRPIKKVIDDIGETFEEWQDLFKQKKLKKPPAFIPGSVDYIREEFAKNRNPHLWKSNPQNWLLTFGQLRGGKRIKHEEEGHETEEHEDEEFPQNPVVASVLYKYQNETIEARA